VCLGEEGHGRERHQGSRGDGEFHDERVCVYVCEMEMWIASSSLLVEGKVFARCFLYQAKGRMSNW
jgi:hypothetical protein